MVSGKKKSITAAIAIALAAICFSALTGCAPGSNLRSDLKDVDSLARQVKDVQLPPVDYMVLINAQRPMPQGWDEFLLTKEVENSLGEKVEVEHVAYEAFRTMQAELEREGVKIGILAARPQDPDPNSESSTGLAIDLYLEVDGKAVTDLTELASYADIWSKVHAVLPNYEFVLRCPEGQEDVTGHPYEPWHIRYVGDGMIAREITAKGTLEDFLGVADECREANAKAREEAEAAAAAEAEAVQTSAAYDGSGSYGSSDIYRAEYNSLYNNDGPSRDMPGWHDGYLETYYNASGHYLASTWTLDEEGFYHDENGRYVVGVDVSHKDEMPYGTVVDTGKGEGVVYDYGSGPRCTTSPRTGRRSRSSS